MKYMWYVEKGVFRQVVIEELAPLTLRQSEPLSTFRAPYDVQAQDVISKLKWQLELKYPEAILTEDGKLVYLRLLRLPDVCRVRRRGTEEIFLYNVKESDVVFEFFDTIFASDLFPHVFVSNSIRWVRNRGFFSGREAHIPPFLFEAEVPEIVRELVVDCPAEWFRVKMDALRFQRDTDPLAKIDVCVGELQRRFQEYRENEW
jgi:hypothetical protein